MKIFRTLSAAGALLLSATVPALAGTTIYSPANGATVPTTFTLNMSADSCASRPVVFVGYSFDSNPYTAMWRDHQINGSVGAAAGLHKLHVKVWNDLGAVCVTDVSVNVGGAPAAAATGGAALSRVPSNATVVSAMQNLGNWTQVHDGGTSGSSSGWTGTQGSPSLTGSAREFSTSFSNYGGQRYSVQFGDDKTSHNFLYDTWIYIAGSASGFKNLEFDLNQTMQNGQTALMGFQCDGWSGTWDYTVNGGSATSPVDKWVKSYANCNPQTWAPNKWHHVQIHITRDDSGWVTYQSVWLDGAQQDLYLRVFSGFALGWGPALVTNFQVDGSSSGSTSSIIYLDSMTIYRW
jgi:hypothetical protein